MGCSVGLELIAQALGAVGADDLESTVDDHVEVLLGRLPLRGEVVAEEEGIGHMQRHRLQRAQVHLATAGDPQFPVRAQEANGAQDAQAMLWGQRVGALQRSAVEGDEEVDRDRIGIDGFERFNRFDDLVVRLTQADDEPRTRREPGAASLSTVSTRSANVWVEQMSA